INLTANVTGGGGTNTFSWSNASTAQTVGVAQTGDYIIEVTDNNTCVGKDTIDIYFQTAPQLVVNEAAGPLYTSSSIPGVTSKYLGSFVGHSYYLIEENLTWPSANARAKNLGGDLISLNNQNLRNWVLDQWSEVYCCGVWVGGYFDAQTNSFKYTNGDPFEYWSGDNGPNGPGSSHPYVYQTNSGGIYNRSANESRYFIVEFPSLDAPVTFNQAFCDSIELKAKSFVSADEPGFTEIYWTDAQGDTINETEYNTFYTDTDVTLHGMFVRSDGQTCDISSTTYSFDVFNSPNLVVTNYSGTADLLGGDTIVLVATTDAGTVSWVDRAGTVTNNDTLFVTQPGIYTAKATTANCESFEDIQVYEPIYVAKTGDNSNDGSFANPYLTIQKGIDEASEGQKIYVLPGTYIEGTLDFEISSGVYKSVYLASDLIRTGDSTAIAGTKIDADADQWLINIQGQNSTTIQGFTLTGQEAGNDYIGALIYLSNGASLTFKDLIVRDNTSNNWTSESQVVNARNQGTNIVFDNVQFKDNSNSNSHSQLTVFLYDRCAVDFINCTWEGNYSSQSVVRVQNYATAYFENNLFVDNYGGYWGIIDAHDSQSKVTLMNSSIVNNLSTESSTGLVGIGGNTNTIEVINSVLGTPASNQEMIRNNSSTTNSFVARNSVLSKDTANGATYPSKLIWDVDGSNIMSDPQLDTDGTLLATSPAIGIATKNPVTIGSTTYTPPLLDLAGVTRPDPAGSNPDAGAYESDKAQGDLDIVLTQCAYLLEATVLNTTNSTYSWTLNGT
ncbi:MAG: C-type lectin domain-containing protein, partial [Schleiferiaceae bacterium]|nr:C-type lectin domain-containing protein [Schleiferiaceae bacterium]